MPKTIGERLVSDLALAVWYLDDGARRVDSRAFRLHTNDFPLKSVLPLQQTLLQNYGVTCTIQKQDRSRRANERGYLLAIGAKNECVFYKVKNKRKVFCNRKTPCSKDGTNHAL